MIHARCLRTTTRKRARILGGVGRRQVVLLLLCTAALGGPSLKSLFDPGHKDYSLRHYTWKEWQELGPEQRDKAKGIDPDRWLASPSEQEQQDPDATQDDDAGVGGLGIGGGGGGQQPARWPGFHFEERLRKKQQAFEQLLGPGAPSTIAGLVKQLKRIDKADAQLAKMLAAIEERYVRVKEAFDKIREQQIRAFKREHDGRHPGPRDSVQSSFPQGFLPNYYQKSKQFQSALALMQSEGHFHEWVVRRVGDLVGGMTPQERKAPLAALKAGVQSKSWRQRQRCGRILAGVDSPEARALFGNALLKEEDPIVIRSHIDIATRARYPGLTAILAKRLADPQWPVRAGVIQALEAQRSKEAVDLLIARLDHEHGRVKDDLVEALAALTGRRMEPDTATWKLWWDQARATWTPPEKGSDGIDLDAKQDGVYFYGIQTRSKRIVFCIDISGSMDFPLDGQGGKRPARILRAKQELLKALGALRSDASFAIVVYNAGVATWNEGRMRLATGRTKEQARRFVEGLEPLGATNIFDALQLSLQICGAPRGKQHEPRGDTIFFLTDGRPTAGKIVDARLILQEITRLNRQYGVVIHAIGVSKEQNHTFLRLLAKRNRGRYVKYE